MGIISKLQDSRINAINILVEIEAKKYVEIAKKIIENNDYQRKRVKNAGTIYSLLKSDILSGCLIPPIVLASRTTAVPPLERIDAKFISEQILESTADLMILDGLQRTHSLIELFENPENQNLLSSYLIRIEIYLNITEVGILYRMLTLNAGQTPMSLRHQIEILYSNFANKKIGELNIIRQIDDAPRTNYHDYNYSDLIEGYNSFLERNEDPIDRYSLLDIVQSIGKISSDQGDDNSFSHFAEVHHHFVEHLQNISKNWEYPDQPEEIAPEYRVQGLPFGTSPFKVFNRAQALTGFGAAIGSLIDQKVIQNLREVREMTIAIEFNDANRDLLLINKCLDEIKQEAKKIGNAQRMFFRFFFRHIFDKTQGEYYLNFAASSDQAKRRTLANM